MFRVPEFTINPVLFLVLLLGFFTANLIVTFKLGRKFLKNKKVSLSLVILLISLFTLLAGAYIIAAIIQTLLWPSPQEFIP